jgi:hypothetical protein
LEKKEAKDFHAALGLVLSPFGSTVRTLDYEAKLPPTFDKTKDRIGRVRSSIKKLSKTHETSIPSLFLKVCEELMKRAQESARDSDFELASSYDDAGNILLDAIDDLYKDTDLNLALKLGRG